MFFVASPQSLGGAAFLIGHNDGVDQNLTEALC